MSNKLFPYDAFERSYIISFFMDTDPMGFSMVNKPLNNPFVVIDTGQRNHAYNVYKAELLTVFIMLAPRQVTVLTG